MPSSINRNVRAAVLKHRSSFKSGDRCGTTSVIGCLDQIKEPLDEDDMVFTAHCSCSQLFYSATSQPKFHAICHCADCRSASWKPFLETAFFLAQDVHVHGTFESFEFFSARGNQTYRDACPACGDVMADRSIGFSSLIGLAANFLQPCLTTAPQFHMWVQSAVAPVPKDNATPQYSGSPTT
jgi:hypothetical protein